jgi:hypothetical protein
LETELKKIFITGTGTSVAETELEPEPVEQQLFAGARAKVFWPGSGAGYIISYNMLQKP